MVYQYVWHLIELFQWCLGGTLVFDEADIELQSENILITDGGVLQVYLHKCFF